MGKGVWLLVGAEQRASDPTYRHSSTSLLLHVITSWAKDA